MTHPPRLTAALVVLNEAHNLPELLPRLDWVDEIVVVDGGSQDATIELARVHGCRVFERPFDTFARQRNYALQQASGDWVLSIDADERPTPALVTEIRQRIADDRAAAYRVPIRSRIFGHRFRYSGTQDDRPVRLFRRGSAQWIGDVHEVLQCAGPVGQLEAWLEHSTIPDLRTFWIKMDRYTRLEAAARVAAGRRPRWRDAWLAPAREVFRRLIWKKGLFDGPAGWTFCLLSGFSEWVLARRHQRLWRTSPLSPWERVGVRGTVKSAPINTPPCHKYSPAIELEKATRETEQSASFDTPPHPGPLPEGEGGSGEGNFVVCPIRNSATGTGAFLHGPWKRQAELVERLPSPSSACLRKKSQTPSGEETVG